jgi:hypothetical protein
VKAFKQGSALALVLGLAGMTGATAQTESQTSDGPALDVIQVTA